MGFSHSYLSQMIARGGTADQIAKVAIALDIDPFYFDRYHLLTFMERCDESDPYALTIAFALIDGHELAPRKQQEFLGIISGLAGQARK